MRMKLSLIFSCISLCINPLVFADLIDDAMTGNVEAVKQAVDADPELSNFKRGDGTTILSIAAMNGKDGIVEYLLQKGAKVDAKDEYGTALHQAADGQHSKVAKILLKHGANPNSRNKWGRTPLHEASYNTNAHITKILLAAKADPTITDENGLTPLHRCKNAQAAKALIEGGADINAIDKNGFNALHWAASSREIIDRPTIEFLLKSGIKVDIKNKRGETPLQMAIKNAQDELIEILNEYDKGVRK